MYVNIIVLENIIIPIKTKFTDEQFVMADRLVKY